MTNRGWAEFYRGRGYNPIPSEGKRPVRGVYPSDYRHRQIPATWIGFFSWKAVQLMCGVDWDLLMLDIEPASAGVWETIRDGRVLPPTWVSRSGGGGLHYWLRPPAGALSFPSRVLWKFVQAETGRALKGPGIELLGDGHLATVPESWHKSGRAYRWVVGPEDLAGPARIPDWLAAIPGMELQKGKAPHTPLPERGRPIRAPVILGRFTWQEVLEAIPSPVEELQRAGLRVPRGLFNRDGWRECHSIYREDHNPSAMVSERGQYWEDGLAGPKVHKCTLGFFDALTELGRYRSFSDAVRHLGSIYCGRA